MAKYDYVKLAKQNKWSEKELKAYFKFLNNSEDEKLKQKVSKAFRNNKKIANADGISLTEDQQNKGWKYLYNLGFTPKGAERRNSPYGYREEQIVSLKGDLSLIGSYDAGNMFRSYYVPLYEAYSKKARTSMQYYVWGGKIHIVG